MANNHEQFIAFNKTINSNKRATLKKNRDALRERIKNYFSREYPDEIQPKFHWQGSYAMHTILNPLKDENNLGVYDLDDGVYFIGKSEDERHSVQWYHDRIYEAVDGHTSIKPDDNKPCITVNYGDGHHIDLPIYFMVEGDKHPLLAHKTKSWLDTDPRELLNWFNGRDEHPQLRRIVRYLKAWCEYIRFKKEIKMPTGCSLTMLAVKNFKSNERDDIAMKNILVAIHNSLSSKFECLRPTFPKNEDLFEEYSETRKNNFMQELKSFRGDAERAIESKNPHEACMKWQKHFGDRFSCSTAKDEDEDAQAKSFSGTINTNSRFA